ncbi:uncharacterized protein METZ01_LOCUS296964, partial [marine metagenome]
MLYLQQSAQSTVLFSSPISGFSSHTLGLFLGFSHPLLTSAPLQKNTSVFSSRLPSVVIFLTDVCRMSKPLEGKTGVVFGVANKRSIAWGIAQAWHEAGARLA